MDAGLRVTVMAFLIIFGSATFSQLLAFSGASSGLISWATRFDVAPVGMLLIMLLALEVGYTTPPFGLLLFVMKGVAPPGTTMRDIYLAAAPFIACVLLLIALIIVFPPIATWLPRVSL